MINLDSPNTGGDLSRDYSRAVEKDNMMGDQAADSNAVRAFVFDQYIQPARSKGDPLVIIRTGDVADALGLGGVLPKVCGAMGAMTFETEYAIRRVYVHGPLNGANTYFVFDVKPSV